MAAGYSVGQVAAPAKIRWSALSYNEILPRLYLGDCLTAANKAEIAKLGITDMITVETKMLNELELAPSVKRYLYLNAMDHQKQDLMSHFPTTNKFIESALKVPSNRVYIHCVAGISRSATLVIAYLMKTRLLDYNEAFQMVVLRRKIVDPNPGFVEQLKLFHRMNYTIDISNLEYRFKVFNSLVFEFRFTAASQGIQKLDGDQSPFNLTQRSPAWIQKSCSLKSSLANILEQYYNKLNLQQVNQFPQVYQTTGAYKCNKCRTIVFYAPSVIEKSTTQPSSTTTKQENHHYHTSTGSSTAAASSHRTSTGSSKECQFIFIEPQPWMSKINQAHHGSLECYKCKRTLGRFDMAGGENCSCPRHYGGELNIFKIMRKKVDH